MAATTRSSGGGGGGSSGGGGGSSGGSGNDNGAVDHGVMIQTLVRENISLKKQLKELELMIYKATCKLAASNKTDEVSLERDHSKSLEDLEKSEVNNVFIQLAHYKTLNADLNLENEALSRQNRLLTKKTQEMQEQYDRLASDFLILQRGVNSHNAGLIDSHQKASSSSNHDGNSRSIESTSDRTLKKISSSAALDIIRANATKK